MFPSATPHPASLQAPARIAVTSRRARTAGCAFGRRPNHGPALKHDFSIHLLWLKNRWEKPRTALEIFIGMISPSSRAHRSGPPTPLPAAPGEVYIRKIFYCLERRGFVRKRRGCSAGGEEPAVNSERRRETQGPCGAPARGPISPLLPREGAAGLPAGPGAKPCFWSSRREVPADSGCCRGGEQAEPGSTMLRPQGWAAPVPTAAPTTRPVKTHPSPW